MCDPSLLAQIKYFKLLNLHDQTSPNQKSTSLPKIHSNSEIYRMAKKNMKKNWKITGQLDQYFNIESQLPPKLLSIWELNRIGLAERSYEHQIRKSHLKNEQTEFKTSNKSLLKKIKSEQNFNQFNSIIESVKKIRFTNRVEK